MDGWMDGWAAFWAIISCFLFLALVASFCFVRLLHVWVAVFFFSLDSYPNLLALLLLSLLLSLLLMMVEIVCMLLSLLLFFLCIERWI
jgi:hypothetical protein